MSNLSSRREFLKTAAVASAGFAQLAGERPVIGEAMPVDPAGKAEGAVSPHTLQNGQVRLSVSADGRLTELTNLHNSQNYAGEKPLWAMFYREADSWENAVNVSASLPTVVLEGDTLRLRYDKVQGHSRPLAVELELEARLVGDDVHWSARVTNNDPDVTITELHFPLVGACKFRDDQALIWSAAGGQRFENVRARIPRNERPYMGSDQNGIKMTAVYPSAGASTNAFVLAGQEDGLYFGSHDPTFQKTVHLLELKGEDVATGFVKFPFLNKGQSSRFNGYVTSPYSGSWHVAAGKYRAWADSWFKPVEKPQWVQNMTGWQRVILKHQYGEILHPYSEIPQIAADGISSGIQGLLLFGWWKGGMDNDYPNYICDESQGGCATLTNEIRQAQSKGAKVMVYFQGVFVNAESEYCQKQGCPVAIKDIWGSIPVDNFPFSGDGVLTKSFFRRNFYYACPGSQEWHDMLKQFADKAVKFGASAVFFDSFGAGDPVCGDASHGHPVPFMTIGAARADLLRELREHVKAADSHMGIGQEGLTDVISQYADFVHLIGNVGTIYSDGKAGSKPKTENFLEWFRYIYPEIIVSDREIYDDRDVERRVNRALMLGLRSDVDVWRCRGTIRDTLLYRAYLTKADALRMKFAELIMSGQYSDTNFFTLSNEAVDARSFRAGNRTAVVLTQDYLQNVTTNLSVPGYRLVDQGGLGEYSVKVIADGAQVGLAKNALAVAVFTKS